MISLSRFSETWYWPLVGRGLPVGDEVEKAAASERAHWVRAAGLDEEREVGEWVRRDWPLPVQDSTSD